MTGAAHGERAAAHVLSLPIHPELGADAVARVIAALGECEER